MNPPPAAALTTFAFGDAASDAWGAGWFPRPGEPGTLILGTGASAAMLGARLDDASENWHVVADDVELELAPASEAVSLPGSDAPAGYAQLCSISGAASGRAIDSRGRRGEREADPEADRLDSIREVSAWFPAGDGVATIALRPRKHKGHEQDIVSAAILGEDEPLPISDPRLSTTYTTAGRPTRFNLELWPEDTERYARRLAGESTGRGVAGGAGGWQLQVELLRCHSHGEDGTGVYLLARPA